MASDDNIDINIVEDQIKRKLIKKGAFYEATGISRQNYSNFKTHGYIPAKHAKKIADFLDVDTDFLLGKQEDYRTLDTFMQVEQNYSLLTSYNIVAGAGANGYLPDTLESTKIPISNNLIFGADPDFLHIIQVAGDSMEPTIRPNDWLIIDMVSNGEVDRQFEKVDGIYLISKDGSIQIKRLAFRGTKGVDIISDNKMYPIENTLDRNIELTIIGKLFKHVQDLGALAIKELI